MGFADIERAAIDICARVLGGSQCTVTDRDGNSLTFLANFIESYEDIDHGGEFPVSSFSPAVFCAADDVASLRLVSGCRVDVVGHGTYIMSHAKRPGFQDRILVMHEAADED